ncbi:MAG: L-arabinose isomerase, partial [Firmicutes bacterium]|nr:L-arabinose isomerase [Bacillota bacterium]
METQKQFWFIVGSQFLYGDEVLEIVEKRAIEMAEKISESPLIPMKLVYRGTVKTEEAATAFIKQANYDDDCLGIVTWCHTFSPSKLWLNGLKLLQKPWCHFATQYNREIPNDEIDMDFMNLNQAAHGDREHGFIGARLRTPRKIIMGFWQDEEPLRELGVWMRAALGFSESRHLRVVRFGDNMRDVAVTEGDKVMAQEVLGWQVNTWAVGDLVKTMSEVTEKEIDELMAVYLEKYELATD